MFIKTTLKNIVLFVIILFFWLLGGLLFKVDFTFYNELKLPFFTLNYKLISIIWFIIYILITISIIYVSKYTNILKNKDYLFILLTNYISNQLFLYFFFNLRSPFLGFCITTIIFSSSIILYKETKKISIKASKLLIPYLIYNTYALILIISIYFMNF
jgi:tryptophan-rich sensory protein